MDRDVDFVVTVISTVLISITWSSHYWTRHPLYEDSSLRRVFFIRLNIRYAAYPSLFRNLKLLKLHFLKFSFDFFFVKIIIFHLSIEIRGFSFYCWFNQWSNDRIYQWFYYRFYFYSRIVRKSRNNRWKIIGRFPRFDHWLNGL